MPLVEGRGSAFDVPQATVQHEAGAVGTRTHLTYAGSAYSYEEEGVCEGGEGGWYRESVREVCRKRKEGRWWIRI